MTVGGLTVGGLTVGGTFVDSAGVFVGVADNENRAGVAVREGVPTPLMAVGVSRGLTGSRGISAIR